MKLKINDNEFRIKLCLTEKERQNGMQNINFDHTFQGMLFFQNNGRHCFWMKDCIIPLDIIFIKNNIIKKIYSDCQPCVYEDCEKYCGKGEFVLELMGGTCNNLGIEIGDEIWLNL